MRENERIQIIGKNILLLPYERHHVEKYHKWMKSTELQQLTASEPLTLEEEYNMQKSWREDENKCTFIVAEMNTYKKAQESAQHAKEQVEIVSMVGDVNMFFFEENRQVAEVEIMIAEPNARGKGLGKEALCSMLLYGAEMLGVVTFLAKIGIDNKPSFLLFTNLGFVETSRSEVFQEITMERAVSVDFTTLLHSFAPDFALHHL